MTAEDKRMRCLVTGASGHLGSFLTRRLLAEGAEVAVLVRPRSDLWRIADVVDQVTVLRADLADLAALAEALAATTPDTVFHLAWRGVTGERRNDPEQITHNVTGSLELLQLAKARGCGCWIGVGSQAEYGHQDGALSEETPTRPVTAYGVAKFALGLLTGELCRLLDMRFVWLRLLATYGPMGDARHLIPAVVGQLLARETPALTPGEQRWDYLYVDDAVDAICRAARDPMVAGVYNLGSGEAHAVRAIVERIRDLIDPSLPLGFGAVPYRPDQVMHLRADIAKLRATGWAPQVSLDEGLRRTVDWHRSHGIAPEGR